jgi:hypothetical protein
MYVSYGKVLVLSKSDFDMARRTIAIIDRIDEMKKPNDRRPKIAPTSASAHIFLWRAMIPPSIAKIANTIMIIPQMT